MEASALAEEGGVLITMQSLSQGGGDRIAVTLASGFARAGIPTRIVLMSNAGEGEDALKPLIHRDVIIATAGPSLRGPLSRIRERLRGIRFMRRQIEDMGPAIVLAATDNMALATVLASGRRSAGPLVVQKLTNRLFRPNLGTFRRLYRTNLFKFIFERVDLVITLTEGERRNVIHHYPAMETRVQTLLNPHLSDDMFAEARPRPGGFPRLLTAGRMVPQKRFDLLLRALEKSRHCDAKLTIFGDGPLRHILQQLAWSLGIAERVELPGFVPDIVPYIQQSDLVVLSSDYEGLPGVMIRALAVNVPVVTTDSFFSAHELLDGVQSCAVVPTNDAEALANAIDRSLEAPAWPDLRTIVESYRVETATAAYMTALNDLVSGSPQRANR
jgi:glycosyltransferase involved in cell wall biosynthesis